TPRTGQHSRSSSEIPRAHQRNGHARPLGVVGGKGERNFDAAPVQGGEEELELEALPGVDAGASITRLKLCGRVRAPGDIEGAAPAIEHANPAGALPADRYPAEIQLLHRL